MSTLPPEIILYIIGLSVSSNLTTNNTNHYQSRTKTLLSLCRVSTIFCKFATEVLWNEVVISRSNIDLFLEGLEYKSQNSGGVETKVSEIRFEFIKGSEGVDRVLAACKNTITRVTCLLVEAIAVDDLSDLPYLRSLSFSNCSILSSKNPASLHFPQLHHISLNFVSIPLHQLHPMSLPRLQAIALDEMPNFGTIDCPNAFLNRFAPQLTGLALGILTRYDSLSEEINWKSMKELKILSFAASAEWVLYPSRRYGTGEGGAVRDFLHQFEESKLVALHYPYLRNIGFDPLRGDFSFTTKSSNPPECLEHLELIVFSLPEVVYSWAKVLSVEKYGLSEVNSIRSSVLGSRGAVIEWEGEGMAKERIDKRLFTIFWGLMQDLDRGRIGRKNLQW